MASQPPPDECDHREEGCSLFEWPLSDEARHMGAGELLDSLIDAIRQLNADPQWDRTLIFPRFGDVVVDRGRRQVSARCMWKIKPDYQRKGTKK